MQGLWRKTAKLFLKYPILWLPYVCAHLLNDALEMLRRSAVNRIFRWMTTWHSVLGGASVRSYGSAAHAKLAWTIGVTGWSLRYVTLCISAVALVITAALVSMIVRGEQPRLRGALAELRSYPKRILGYSFKLFFLDLAFSTFVSLPALRLSHWLTYSAATTRWTRAANLALTQGHGIVSVILFAWIITPITIRLLRVPGAEPPTANEKKLGRYFVILTGIGGFALGAVLAPLLFRLVTLRPFPEQVYDSLVSLLWIFPYLLGDIGVALIAAGGEWQVGTTGSRFDVHKLRRVAMPLHSGRGDEL